jgi:hypothetical protein
MEVLMRFLISFLIVFCMFMGLSMAQVPPVILPEEPKINDIVMAIVKLFGDWKSLSYQYQISAVIFLLIGLTKNSLVRPHWDKLGDAKVIAAPVLSLVAFLLLVQPFTLEAALAAVTTGAAAVYFSQVFDLIKKIPGVGPMIVMIVDLIGKIFRKPQK